MKSDAGITLLEVLVALVLVAMTGLLIADTFSLTNRLADRQQTQVAAGLERFETAKALTRLIEAMSPPYASRNVAPLEADETGLSFTVRPGALAGGRPKTVVVRHDAAMRALVAEIADVNDADDRELIILGTQVTTVSFSYIDRGDGERWRVLNRWDDGSRLPALVKVRMSFAAPDDRLELSVRPRRMVSTACIVLGWRECLERAS